MPPPDETAREQELITRARTGDDVAFSRLVRRHQASVRRWALSLTGDPSDADEVAQDVLIAAHRGLADFRGAARFATWLYGITRRAALDLLRRRRRRAARLDPLDDRTPAWRADPARQAEARDQLDRVHQAWRTLPRRQREVFDLVDLRGYAPAEAAGLLGVDAVTARTHLFRARRTLRRLMIEDE